MAPKPPKLPGQKVGGGATPKSTSPHAQQKNETTAQYNTRTYGLAGSATGDIASTPINGARELLGVAQTGPSGWNAMPAKFRQLDAVTTIDEFKKLSGPKLADIQYKMYQAGLYGKSQPTYGEITADDLSAFKKLIVGYASNPDQGALGDYLDYGAQVGAEINAASGRTRAPLTTSLTSPIDLENVARNVARTLYAGEMSPDELEQFVSNYQSAEAGYQSQAYGMADTGGTITQPPSASASAEDFLRKNHGDQVNASQFGDVLDTYLSLIRSGGGR